MFWLENAFPLGAATHSLFQAIAYKMCRNICNHRRHQFEGMNEKTDIIGQGDWQCCVGRNKQPKCRATNWKFAFHKLQFAYFLYQQELHAILPLLLENIFGFHNQLGWGIGRVTKTHYQVSAKIGFSHSGKLVLSVHSWQLVWIFFRISSQSDSFCRPKGHYWSWCADFYRTHIADMNFPSCAFP